MGRYPQSYGKKGSKKWIQILIDKKPELLNKEIIDNLRRRKIITKTQKVNIKWLSPSEKDEYAEYRDQAFLDKLEVKLEKVPLEKFWPKEGPQWDGLGKSSLGIFLVEAKSHIGELISTLRAEDENSLRKIRESLEKTKFLNSKTEIDWSSSFYQYTNRLAHLYLLRELNHVPAYLVFVYFINDTEMKGPKTEDEWKGAIKLLNAYLGIGRHKLQKSVIDVFIDVSSLR